uniref:Reverse transcriptase Ty1/copia-type domain-containing protein n=1 Tax=Solanum lycopersicum TaxID=4081 RepID=A0A3Q7HLX2_SOLLC
MVEKKFSKEIEIFQCGEGSNQSHVLELVLQLGKKFSMKDLGPLHFFLGIEVNYFEGGIHLNQSKYGAEMFAKTEMSLAKAVATPLARKRVSQFMQSPNVKHFQGVKMIVRKGARRLEEGAQKKEKGILEEY